MAKKQRTVRPPRSADMSRYGGMASTPTTGKAGSGVPDTSQPVAGKSASAAARAIPETDYAAEYRYVSSDLRRIAILAVAMFAVLIALSFVVS